jgi:ABC-type glycerol-3-phosphate transport system substrate-binding protein
VPALFLGLLSAVTGSAETPPKPGPVPPEKGDKSPTGIFDKLPDGAIIVIARDAEEALRKVPGAVVLTPEEFKKWEVSLLPTMDAGDPQKTGTGGWTMGAFSDDPEKVEMCMEFTKDVYIGEGNQVTGQLPTNPQYFDTLDKFQDPIYDEFNEALKYGEARPGVPIYPKISEELQIAIATVLTEEATPEEALDRAGKASLASYEGQ